MTDNITPKARNNGFVPVTLYRVGEKILAGIYVGGEPERAMVAIEHGDEAEQRVLIGAMARDLSKMVNWMAETTGKYPEFLHVVDCGEPTRTIGPDGIGV